jgi:hypothetical protein
MSIQPFLSVKFLCIIFAVMIGIFWGDIQPTSTTTEVPIVPVIDNAVDQRTEKLITWVYVHSERISRETAKQIVDGAMQYKNGIFMLALFEVESNFIPSAISNKGAKGLGQIHWPSHGGVLIRERICKNERDLYHIETNIRATDLILTDMLQRANGDIVKTLTLYLGTLDKVYVMRILNNFVQLTMTV